MAASDLYEREWKTGVVEESKILSSDDNNGMKDIVTAYKSDRKYTFNAIAGLSTKIFTKYF
jgi:hypothetical protein